MKQFENLVEIVDQAKADLAKFETGNAAAGVRLRNRMLEIKKLAQEVRTTVQDIKKMK